MKIYETVGQYVPYRSKLRKLLDYTDIPVKHVRLAGFMFTYSTILGITSAAISALFGLSLFLALIVGFGFFIAFQAIVYFLLLFIAESRARQVEEVLPDALLLMSANVRAGLTVEKAIWLAARPEFGPLQQEIERVGAETAGGKSVIEALSDMPKRIKSDMLTRAVKMIIEGIRSGGELAGLLEETGNEIRSVQAMQKEVRANVMMYSMFIVFASVLGAPLLFGVSLYFIDVVNSLWGTQLAEAQTRFEMQAGVIKMTAPQITVGELQLFAIACIILTTTFASLIIGLIQTGKASQGLKFAPAMSVIALLIFFLTRTAIVTIFGGMLGF
jgi:flagellar protein FlaJ